MQTPPPPPQYELPQQREMRRTNRTLWIVAACIAIPCCGGLIALGFFGFRLYKESLPFVGCMASAQSIAEALEDHAKANNGKLPKASTWQDDLRKSYETRVAEKDIGHIYTIRTDGPWGCWDKEGRLVTGFVFNDKYSGKPTPTKTDAATEPIVFEAERAALNQHGPYRIRQMGKSPLIVLGKRRGWVEIGADRRLYVLVDKDGRAFRYLAGDMDEANFDIDRKSGVEVPAPGASGEPSKG